MNSRNGGLILLFWISCSRTEKGYEVCKKIRGVSNVPIFFLSAKTEEIDKILGFAIGGDDYITKPFSPKEVAYRIKSPVSETGYY